MRRTILILAVLISLASLSAETWYLASLDSSELMTRESLALREAVRSLDIRGLHIYHYNCDKIWLGSQPAKRVSFQKPA
jgi:hypothetical protein